MEHKATALEELAYKAIDKVNEAKDRAIIAAVQHFNAVIDQRECYICYSCNKLYIGEPSMESTTKWGDERPFCEDCVDYCETCEESFVSSMAYRHEDCKMAEEEEDMTDDDEEEKDPCGDIDITKHKDYWPEAYACRRCNTNVDGTRVFKKPRKADATDEAR